MQVMQVAEMRGVMLSIVAPRRTRRPMDVLHATQKAGMSTFALVLQKKREPTAGKYKKRSK